MNKTLTGFVVLIIAVVIITVIGTGFLHFFPSTTGNDTIIHKFINGLLVVLGVVIIIMISNLLGSVIKDGDEK